MIIYYFILNQNYAKIFLYKRRNKDEKKFVILGCSILALTLVGCGAEEKTFTCTLYKKDVINNYELNSTYKVYATGDVVNKVETTEVVKSNEKSVIDSFEETLEKTYKAMDENKITKEELELTSITTIDYNNMDIEQLIKDDASMKAIVNKDKKITIEGIKNVYEQLGAECK